MLTNEEFEEHKAALTTDYLSAHNEWEHDVKHNIPLGATSYSSSYREWHRHRKRLFGLFKYFEEQLSLAIKGD